MGRSTAEDGRTLGDLPTNYLLCRRGSGVGHAWNVVTYWQAPGGQVARLTRCSRCKAEKEDYYTGHMSRIRTAYFYPDSYGVDGAPEPWEVRMELVGRFTIEAERPKQRPGAVVRGKKGR